MTDPLAPLPATMDSVKPLQMPQKGGMFAKRKFGIMDAVVHGLMGAAAARGNTAPLQTYQSAQNARAQQMQEEQAAQRNFQMQKDLALYRSQIEKPDNPFARYEQFNQLPEDQRNGILSAMDAMNPIYEDVWTPNGMVRRLQPRALPTFTAEDWENGQPVGGSGGNVGERFHPAP